MSMQLKKASRKQTKIKIMVSGPSGSGKTYSSLLLAKGLIGNFEKVALIDTERGSGDLYSDLGPYNTLTLESPFTPEKYIEAINTCVSAGMEVIIIDSMTHEWDGKGGILEIHDSMTGNSYTNWNKLTPRHNKFIDAIMQSPVHMIVTARSKQDYVLNDKNGKQVPEKVGMKAITREGFDYEVTVAFEIDIKHNATSTKDRTKLFADRFPFVISDATGKEIIDWCNSGDVPEPSKLDKLKAEINTAKTVEALIAIGDKIAAGGFSDFEKDVLRKLYVQSPIYLKDPSAFKPKTNNTEKKAQTPNNTNGVQLLNLIDDVAKEHSLDSNYLVRFTAFVNKSNGNSKALPTKESIDKMFVEFLNTLAKAGEELPANLLELILVVPKNEAVTETKVSEYDKIKGEITGSNDKAFLYFIEDDIKNADLSDSQKRFLKSILDKRIKEVSGEEKKTKAKKGATA